MDQRIGNKARGILRNSVKKNPNQTSIFIANVSAIDSEIGTNNKFHIFKDTVNTHILEKKKTGK